MRRFVLVAVLAAACDPYREGERLLLSSDPRAAAAAIHPKDERGHRLRAHALLAAGEPEEARIEARMAIALRPRDAEAWLVLARIERASGRPGAALAAVENAAERAPERHDFDRLRAELLLERARALAEIGKRNAAERDFQAVLRLQPGLGAEVAQARVPPATAPARAVVQPAPAVAARFQAGARQSALDALADWVGAEPAVSLRAPAAIQILEAAGEKEAAVGLQERVVAEDPTDVPARIELARLFIAAGKSPRAGQEIDEAVWVAHDRAAAMRQAAAMLERAGQRRQACSWLGRALAFGVEPHGLRALGECLQRDGQTEQARAIFDRACSLDPDCHPAATR
ncbi:MAG TPA: tetratricopeptide repeat protein [Polyangia bacterium]|nr:tetratricopeptide repeat protein [Polyangia bacterium]